MAATSQTPRNTPEIAERRARVRAPVTPPIYVSLDNVNGGLVFNISEDGLALTAALDLADDDLLALRIFLPDSKGWVEARGKIAWRGASEKEGGIRFVGLAEEAHQRIREWLVTESFQGEAKGDPEVPPDAEEYPPNEATAMTPVLVPPHPVDSIIAEEEHTAEPALLNNPSLLVEQPAGVLAQPLEQPILAESEPPADAESSPELTERRSHERCAIDAVSYIRLGRENGGTLLNISAGGFAVKTAMSVSDGDLARIRIQFTEAWDCLEVSGKIAWSNEREKRAGIQFVSLGEEARLQIARWLSLDEPAGEFQEEDVKNPDSQAAAASRLVAPGTGSNRLAAAGAAVGSPSRELAKETEIKPKSRWEIFQPSLGSRNATLWHLVAAFVLAEITALAIVWVAVPHGLRQAVIGFVAKDGAVASEPALLKKPFPKSETATVPPVQPGNTGSQVHEVEAAPANSLAVRPQGSLPPVSQQVRSAERPAKTPTPEGTVHATESPLQESPSTKRPDSTFFAMPHPTVEHPQSQGLENAPTQLTANTVTSAPSSFSPPTAGGLPEVREKEVPAPPVEPPVSPVAAVWSVVVSTDPYPSIKVPPKMSSRKSSGEGNLQIGRIISRVDPIYPEDAKSQGIEGTVKLHVIAGRDGAVQKVEPISGPALLTKAAISAVREWHYAKTLLDGQPMETEQDVVVNFRKVSPPSSKK
jgi:outer membrane biosynthesis protein TonB